MHEQRAEIIQWLEERCPLKIEYDFYYQFYDDLDDCFDDLEPWRLWGEWATWDKKFTGNVIS